MSDTTKTSDTTRASDTTKTTVYVGTDEYTQLRKLARARGTSTAMLVREAIAEYVARAPRGRRPKSLGMGRSGDGRLAENAEKHLRGFGSK
jgi:predicted transcriptional regulator